MPFDLEKFLANPREELLTLRLAKKQELLTVAIKCQIPTEITYVKARIIDDILQFLLNKNVITEDNEDVEELRTLTGSIANVDPEVEKLKLQLKVLEVEQERRLAEQEREQERRLAEQERRLAEQEREQERRLAEQERRREELEHQKRLNELELEKLEKSAFIRLKAKADEEKLPMRFDVTKASRLVPEFNDKDPEVFFQIFEDIATSLNWPPNFWTILVRNHLKGKAAYVASQLIEVKEYKDLKKTVLDAYAITVEGYRQTFRNSFKTQSQTFVEFCNIKVRQFNKWLERAGVNDLDSLKNLILLEEFLRKVPSNIATYVHFKGEIEVLKAASLADDYYLIHRNSKDSSKIVSSPKSHQVSCAYCKKDGHSIENCPSPKCQKSEVSTDGKSKKSKGAVTCHAFVHSQDLEPFNEFMCEASLNDSSVTALRDSASSQTIISAASQDNLKYTKEYIAVSDLNTTTLLPEAEVDIACPYFTGKAKVAVLDKPLPCYPIQMIIGNDLAGSSVLKPNLIVTTPEVVIKDELSKKPGKISQVITRSSSKTSSTNFSPKVKNDRITEALDLVDIKKDQFTVLQQKDSSLKALWDKVVDPTDNPKTPYFYVEKNILFRHYKSPKAPTSNSWHDCFQVVFPEPLRKPLLDLAHSTESHLGVNKTYKRLFEDFYWPEMRKDIKEFIASCHHCQITD
ncbi:uncharacterized protein [Palaemon carinicauda]|uniref:uncharacterized protein n=1 Tax=Palaemon carinicauda TaxID=392227 RepID=UPI0035B5CB7E